MKEDGKINKVDLVCWGYKLPGYTTFRTIEITI